MDTERIIKELEAERDRLAQAISALQGAKPGRGRPAGRSPLSPAARKRISEGMKKRWAAKRKKIA